MEHIGYQKLLSLLASDPQVASRAYQDLRRRLIQLFVWRGAAIPQDLADETLSRVARRLGEGEEIRSDDPFRYCCGFAFRVFHEKIREARRERELRESGEFLIPHSEAGGHDDSRLGCLDDCLRHLREKSRKLILRYYHGDGRAKIDQRQQLADELDIAQAALRNRAQRVRAKLVICVEGCLENQQRSASPVKAS
jgi:DNA-directed RNA polymerase specialized sigma24 family protein